MRCQLQSYYSRIFRGLNKPLMGAANLVVNGASTAGTMKGVVCILALSRTVKLNTERNYVEGSVQFYVNLQY
jgi:hypothetical protein